MKKFALPHRQIVDLVRDAGAAIVTDRIMVDGELVHFAYREMGLNELDSGWRFFSGDESPEYLADPANSGVYDINTIANYDRAIIPILNAPIGTEFIRDSKGHLIIDNP